MHKSKVRDQFALRSGTFDVSANWITDRKLVQAHVNIAGPACGKGLELCCGTGIIGRALAANGWQMTGIDITKEMVDEASKHFPAIQGDAENLPFEKDSFDLVVMRQALLFLETKKAFEEVRRVLKESGTFIMSQTVPFSEIDSVWLKKIHLTKQAQMQRFYTHEHLKRELTRNGFAIRSKEFLRVRESITEWMKHAPELSAEKREEVIRLIRDAPEKYKLMRNIELADNELWEDWNWVVFSATPSKK